MGVDVHAKKLRGEMGVTKPPFLPTSAFEHLSVSFQERPLDSCLGMTIRVNGMIGVLVSSEIAESGRKVFTAAHELGHVVIPSHAKIDTFKCAERDFNILNTTGVKPLEREANEFAAEWLMPTEFIKAYSRSELDFDVISDFAETFGVSLTAAAIRLVGITQQDMMLVVSENGFMKYSVRSKDFPYYLDFGKLPPTYALRASKDGKSQREFMAVSSDNWFKGRQPESDEVYECSIKLGSYGTVLTMLWVE